MPMCIHEIRASNTCMSISKPSDVLLRVLCDLTPVNGVDSHSQVIHAGTLAGIAATR